jgi:predicted ABC-class ATPase
MTHKKHEQLRAPFSDYTPENQERDAEKFLEAQKKDVYIVKVKGNYGAYLVDGDDNISYNNFTAKNLKDFYTAAKRFYKKMKIEPKFHCVLNQGIEEHILQQIIIQNLIKDR